MKLKNIKIENYRFFKEEQEFDFTSKEHISQNILLYGENGSGKTSLYNALKDFFFHYKNPSESKTKIKENKNIFTEPTDKPKIEITFENDISISFTETGFDKDDLKDKIERVSKSKLFLTYKDIYTLNNIFKKDISYKEFKEIFTILYFDELDDKFNEFENTFNELHIRIKDIDTLMENYKNIKNLIETFGETYAYELEPIEKRDAIDKDIVPNVYNMVFYLDENIINDLEINIELLENFFNIFENVFDIANMSLFSEDYDSFALVSRYKEIIEEVKKYTKENDRYNEESIICLDEEIHHGNSYLDDFSTNISMNAIISYGFVKCESISKNINEGIFNKLSSSIEKINDILDFLEIDIKIEKVFKKPFITFNIKDGTLHKVIRNIDFKILLSDVELRNHWSSLNEAKLSALNLAIYLSSVLGKKPDIPILVLDDLLISLDMNNRDKVLSLLLDRTLNQAEQTNFFDDEYQMFIFTHDRALYEKAKQIFEYKAKKRWKYFEMFVDLEDNEKYQIPYIKENEQIFNNMTKVDYHFKNKDYPACANYLRKEVEKKLDSFLIINNLDEKIKLAKLKENEHIVSDVVKELKKLIPVLKQFEQCKKMPESIQIEKCNLFSEQIIKTIEKIVEYVENDLHFEEFEDMKLILKSILHPQSHSDNTKPLYKRELEEAINLMKKFNKLIEENNL